MAPRLAIRYRTPLSNPRVPISYPGCVTTSGNGKNQRLREEMATRMGFEPTISGVTGQYVNRYTTGP